MRNARTATFFTVGLVLFATACGGSTTNADGTPRPRRDVITAEELANLSVTNAYDAILRLRPSWFRTRGQTSTSGAGGIMLYIDGVSAGDLDRLRATPIDRIREMRRISANDATTRWGTGHQQGAIEIITRG